MRELPNDHEIAEELRERPDPEVTKQEQAIEQLESKLAGYRKQYEVAHEEPLTLERERDALLPAVADGDSKARKRAAELKAAQKESEERARDLAKVVSVTEQRISKARSRVVSLKRDVVAQRSAATTAQLIEVAATADAALDAFLQLAVRRQEIGLRCYDLERLVGNNNYRLLPEFGLAHVLAARTAALLRTKAFPREMGHAFPNTLAEYDRLLAKRRLPDLDAKQEGAEVA